MAFRCSKSLLLPMQFLRGRMSLSSERYWRKFYCPLGCRQKKELLFVTPSVDTFVPVAAYKVSYSGMRKFPKMNQRISKRFNVRPKYCSDGANVKPMFYDYLPEVFHTQPEYEKLFYDPRSAPIDTFHSSVKAFIEVASNNPEHPITSPEWTPVIEDLLANASTFNMDELMSILYHMTLFPRYQLNSKVDKEQFPKIWGPIDKACMALVKGQTSASLLKLCDLWHRNFVLNGEFRWFVVRKCIRRMDRLTKEEFVLASRALGFCDDVPRSISIFEFETNLMKFLNELVMGEVSVVLNAIIKVRNHGVKSQESSRAILNKAIAVADTIASQDVEMLGLMMAISGSRYGDIEAQTKFFQALMPQLHRLSKSCLVRLALACIPNGIRYFPLLRAITLRFEDEIEEATLWQLERVAHVLTMLDIPECEPLLVKIIEEFKTEARAQEIEREGRIAMFLLYDLSMKGIYDFDMMKKYRTQESIEKYIGDDLFHLPRELGCLQYAIELEVPDYDEPKLSQNHMTYLNKKHMMWLPETYKRKDDGSAFLVPKYIEFVQNIEKCMSKKLGGDRCVLKSSILPVFWSIELIFYLDSNGNAMEVPDYFRELACYDAKYIPEHLSSNGQLHCIFTISRSRVGQEIGLCNLQKRLMEKIGYVVHTVSVPGNDWTFICDDIQSAESIILPHLKNSGVVLRE